MPKACAARRRSPYASGSRSASNTGSSSSLAAVCTTRSRIVGMPHGEAMLRMDAAVPRHRASGRNGGDRHTTNRLGPVGPFPKLLTEPGQPLLHTCRVASSQTSVRQRRVRLCWRSPRRRRAIQMSARSTLSSRMSKRQARLRPSSEAIGLRIQIVLERLDLFWSYEAHRQSLNRPSLQAYRRQGSVPRSGITRFHQYHDPLRLTGWSPFAERSRH